MNHFEMLGETIVQEMNGIMGDEGAKVAVDATSDIIKKGLAAYQAGQKAQEPSTALVPVQSTINSPGFFTSIYGGIPGWGWLLGGIVVAGFGYMVLSSWVDGRVNKHQ